MKLLHLTDIHLTGPGKTIGGRDPNANFRRALDHALAAHGDAEAIFITGDLSDWGERADYERLREIIAGLPVPVHLCIGNHDDRAIFADVFPERVSADGFVQQIVPLSIGHGILLDSWGPETHAGHFCEARAAWLGAQLAALEGPVWLFVHHNIVPTGVGPMDQIMLRDAALLGETIAPHAGKIRHIFHGHCHLPLTGSFMGIPFSAPRGTNHAGWASFGETELLSSSDLPEAYGVVLADAQSTMVHMVEYGYAGALRIEGSPDYAQWDKDAMAR